MQTLDIILVSYNSAKWIENCLKSIEKVNYPLKNIHLSFVDNHSSDETVSLLEAYEGKELFGSFHIHAMKQNLGFGPANNYGARQTQQPYIFFLNIDTELETNAIHELMSAVSRADDSVGLWEARQFPYEHPKLYNPVTFESSWASAAACMVRRDYFEQIGMFDEKIFMYAEDVDLSWRFRAFGYKVLYCPSVVVYHYTYQSAGEVKPNQFYNSTFNNLMLRYKFGTWRDILRGYVLFNALMAVHGPAPGHRKRIVKNILKSFPKGMQFRQWYRKYKSLNFKPSFRGWDYELIRDGAFYVNELPAELPLVSVLVRTCNRPSVLRETLISLRNQTYSNLEVVVVEDGQDTSRQMIEEEFSDLNLIYHATGDKVGRCRVGNIAMELATGKYLNFLDDDDLMYADHVEVLVSNLVKHPNFKAAYAIAFETPIEVISTEPYQYHELYHNVQYREKFNRMVLLHHNYFPIQTVMFAKELFEQYGGIDESLEVLEDWDLWLRYALQEDFLYVEKLTSIYRVPSSPKNNHERQELFDKYLSVVREKHFNKKIELSLGDIFQDVEKILNRPHSIIHLTRGLTLPVLIQKVKNKSYTKLKQMIRKM